MAGSKPAAQMLTARWRQCVRAMLLTGALVHAAAPSAQTIPAPVALALQQAGIQADNVAMFVAEVGSPGRTPRLAHRAREALNPASTMKLVTTYAALDLLGSTFAWSTPVYVEGQVKDGVLVGNLYLKGMGDPKLVSERLWLLMRRVQGLGIRSIQGDIVLERSAFETVETDPGLFDGEPLRPYNAAPDALLINFKSHVFTFVPDRSNQVAQVQMEPPMAGVQVPASVPLSSAACTDYRAALKADFSDPRQVRFAGTYPAACGERVWPVAAADPKGFAVRAVEGMWRSLGGALQGIAREGSMPPALLAGKPALEFGSPTLAEVIRDINKFSNNVMAQQLFLTLSLQSRLVQGQGGGQPNATLAASREVVQRWWRQRLPDADPPVLDNGSGLSRSERISAQSLGRLLLHAHASPLMPELLSSLPISGVDGTLRNSRAQAKGSAHLKTGTLRDVAAIAGYVLGQSGRRHAVVMIVNQPGAAAARPAMDALVDWVANDR
jgi:D-alanyl-D-alanine carboxypeptidase/D-alanyl-D-alanine-endopeptidase (penicillin-binding protein 4)